MTMESFGRILKEVRKAKKLTLQEIGNYIGKSVGYISDIEHERKGPPDLETVRKIEECMGITDDSLVSLASKLRRKISPNVTQRIKMRPKLSELLLRADTLSDKELESLINKLSEGEESCHTK